MSTSNDLPEELQLVGKYFSKPKLNIEIDDILNRKTIGIIIRVRTKVAGIDFVECFSIKSPMRGSRKKLIKNIINWDIEKACAIDHLDDINPEKPLFDIIDEEYHPIILDKLQRYMDKYIYDLQHPRKPMDFY